MLAGLFGQVVAAFVPIGGDPTDHRIHTGFALALGISLPLLMWRFAAGQAPGTWRRLAYRLFFLEAAACVVGLYLSARSIAPVAEILPGIAFHVWVFVVTFRSPRRPHRPELGPGRATRRRDRGLSGESGRAPGRLGRAVARRGRGLHARAGGTTPGQIHHGRRYRSPSDNASTSTSAPAAHATAAALEQRPGPRPPLADPDHLGPIDHDLARTQTGEADQRRPGRRRAGWALVDRPPRHAHDGQGPGPRPTEPHEGPTHVGLGQEVARGQEHVGPHRLRRPEQHRPPTALPADHVDPSRRNPPPVDDAGRLGAPEHQRGPVDLDEPGRPHRGRGPRPVEKRGRRPPLMVDGESDPAAGTRPPGIRPTGPPPPAGRAPTGGRSCPRPR